MYTYDNPLKETIYEDVSFENNILNYIIIEQTSFYKIERYVTCNYVKTPIYENELTVKRKIVAKVNKTILNIKLFSEYELKEMNVPYELKKIISKKLNYVPKFIKYTDEIISSNEQIKLIESKMIPFVKKPYNPHPELLQEKPSNLFLRIFFAFFTLGFSFLGFVSKKQAAQNKIFNEKQHEKWLEDCKKIDEINAYLKKENELSNQASLAKINEIKNWIAKLEQKINDIDNEYDFNEFTDLKDCFNSPQNHLKERKGVYIIKNATKNKYYVGQSKDLYKRIFTNHFDYKTMKPRNHIFFEDWYNGDQFKIRIIFLETKDELDKVEMEYITHYDSFNNGYNSTKGNK